MLDNLSPLDPATQFPDLRLLRVGEAIEDGDLAMCKGASNYPIPTWAVGFFVQEADGNNYFRPLVNPSPKGAGDLDPLPVVADAARLQETAFRAGYSAGYDDGANRGSTFSSITTSNPDGAWEYYRDFEAHPASTPEAEPAPYLNQIGAKGIQLEANRLMLAKLEAEQSPSSLVALECMVLFNEKNISQAVCNLEDHSYYHPLLDDRPGWRWVRMVPAALPTDAKED